jgi:cytochrome c-type biogenesis protein CcmH/NrfF
VNGWGWVMWGYGILLIALGTYVWTLAIRTRAVRQRLDDAG